jgi:hypothetical protein
VHSNMKPRRMTSTRAGADQKVMTSLNLGEASGAPAVEEGNATPPKPISSIPRDG